MPNCNHGGQFHGVIEATTPSGWRWRSIRLVSLFHFHRQIRQSRITRQPIPCTSICASGWFTLFAPLALQAFQRAFQYRLQSCLKLFYAHHARQAAKL